MPLEYALQHSGRFAPANPWKQPMTIAKIDLQPGELGIGNLPHQCVQLAMHKGFHMNLMVVGESGMGKSTFINTLFSAELMDQTYPDHKRIRGKTVEITHHNFALNENGVPLGLTVIDTPGFGDQLNREVGIHPIIDYIDRQFDEYFGLESSEGFRKLAHDPRVHVVLYFISPNCQRLKEMDAAVLKILSSKCNVIPVIAKADTMTFDERLDLKAKIISDLIRYDVKLYPGSFTEDREENAEFEAVIPFSVIGADSVMKINGKKVRARKYRWGVAEVENEDHCDFIKLRKMLMNTNLRDILETCHNVHYFNYRLNKLRTLGRPISILQSDEQFELEIDSVKKQFAEEMAKREAEMRGALLQKIKEKEANLREAEEALARKERDLMAELEEQKRQVEAEEREIESIIQRNALAAYLTNTNDLFFV